MIRSIDIKQLLKNNVEEMRIDFFSVNMQREILKRLENAEKEKERIIKELEKEIVPTYLLCEADTYNKAIHKAIEIVKNSEKR